MKRQLRNFLHAEGREKMEYVADRFRTLRWHFDNLVWRAGYRLFRLMGRPLPRRLVDPQRFMAKAVITNASDECYSGRIAVFRPCDRVRGRAHDDALGWRRISADVEVFETAGDHKHVLLPPYVSSVGGQLRQCLQRVRST